MKRAKLKEQVKSRVNSSVKRHKEYEGNDNVISTGSTLLDLAISGGRFEEGGIPGGILVEIFGPSGCGKTSLLCEIAGNVQRKGGQVLFMDPEGRLNKKYAEIFGLKPDKITIEMPDTVPEVFKPVRKWKPEPEEVTHGIFTDSLAALSTKLELESEDKMGARRAKEFSEETRKTCRILTRKGFLMVCSNQVRQNIDAGVFGQKYTTPGGEAIGFYSSLRLRCFSPKKIKQEETIAGKKVQRVIGVETQIEVFKSSIWKPYREATVIIIFDYGIDDVRANLQFLKKHTGKSIYAIGETKLHKSLDGAIRIVEEDNLETKLKKEVIGLWREIETKFNQKRKPKVR